jgi:hypothetical protein
MIGSVGHFGAVEGQSRWQEAPPPGTPSSGGVKLTTDQGIALVSAIGTASQGIAAIIHGGKQGAYVPGYDPAATANQAAAAQAAQLQAAQSRNLMLIIGFVAVGGGLMFMAVQAGKKRSR